MKRKDSATNFLPFGQTSISSFLSKSRAVQEDEQSDAPNHSVSQASNKDSVKVTTKTIKEKKSSFSSIGATFKNTSIEKEKDKDKNILSEAIFKQFNSSALKQDNISGKEKAEDRDNSESETIESEVCFESRKRKNPFGDDSKNPAPKILVLGDDPKPRSKGPKPKKRVTASKVDKTGKPIYNHYANGRGWWDGDREGVDNEEVGWTEEMWEGMGSSVLGNLY
ncbi:hypothetical protein LUZ60_014940 [Juncus effusus]|nr:hypothetical protein LUZ60_014940 [Juncus effusus]